MFIAASSFTRYRVTYGIGTRWHDVLVLHTWQTTTLREANHPLLFGIRSFNVAASCCVIGFAVADKILPHLSQITARCRSDEFSNRSCRRNEAPWAMIESLSISPNRIPPCLFLPFRGCLVSWLMGPVARTCDLSLTYSLHTLTALTMWRSLW